MSDGTTTVVRVEHPVPDFEAWKELAFDRDPIGREDAGVRSYRVLSSCSAGWMMAAVELDFDTRAEAESFAGALHELWQRVRERFGWRELPEARLYDLVETGTYPARADA